jgi:hypothetical protein
LDDPAWPLSRGSLALQNHAVIAAAAVAAIRNRAQAHLT